MGGGVSSTNIGELNSPILNQAKSYFRNSAILKGFWLPLEKESENTVSLLSIHKFLSSTNPEFSVVLYTGPFLGPFATSKFCLKQAYYTSTDRDGNDLNNMIINENELILFLKHLFFFHRLYSLFGDNIRHDAIISFSRFQEIYDDLNDENVSEEITQKKYRLMQTTISSINSSSPTYRDFVVFMTETVFNSQNMFSVSQGEAILDKQEETLNQLVSRLPPCPPTSRSVSGSSNFDDDSPTNLSKSGSVYVLWHNVTSPEEWLASIQSLSLPHFSAMLDQIKCFRCCFAQSLHDSSIFITILWLNGNGGALFELFMKEQLNEGGVYANAINDDLISGPFESLQFVNECHVGWETEILPNDILNMMSFKTKSFSKFSRAYTEYQSKIARENGHILQGFYGQQMISTPDNSSPISSSSVTNCEAPGILEHYTVDGWKSGGYRLAEDIINNPPASYRALTDIKGVPCRVLASFEHSNWLRKR